jgi:hypothetical protein
MASEPFPPSFDTAVWGRVWRDFRTGLRARLRMSIEGLLTFGLVYAFLARLGSADAAWDFSVEKALAIPAALACFMLMHLAWSWARAPRHLYNDLRAALIDQQSAETARVRMLEAMRDASEVERDAAVLLADTAKRALAERAVTTPQMSRAIETFEIALGQVKAESPGAGASNCVAAGLSVLRRRFDVPITSEAELEDWLAEFSAEVLVIGHAIYIQTGLDEAFLKPNEPPLSYEGNQFPHSYEHGGNQHGKSLNAIQFYSSRLERILTKERWAEERDDRELRRLKELEKSQKIRAETQQALKCYPVGPLDIPEDPARHDREAAESTCRCIKMMEARRDTPAISQEELRDWLDRFDIEKDFAAAAARSTLGGGQWKLPDKTWVRMTKDLAGQRDAELESIDMILESLRHALKVQIGHARHLLRSAE